MEEPKLRDSKKAGMLTFSNLNYVSLSLKLQEKSASGGRGFMVERTNVTLSTWSPIKTLIQVSARPRYEKRLCFMVSVRNYYYPP